MTLEKYINDNINMSKNDIYYNESFCNITLDYIGSYVGGIEDLKQIDIDYLKNNGYEPNDFIQYD